MPDQNKRQAPNQGSENWQKQAHSEQSGQGKSQPGGFTQPKGGEQPSQEERRQSGSDRDR